MMGVARCETSTTYDMDLYEDAFNRLSRLRDQYEHEKEHRTLTTLQLAKLSGRCLRTTPSLRACSMRAKSASMFRRQGVNG